MESVAELIVLMGVLLLSSAVLGLGADLMSGAKDITHLMLPDDIMRHLEESWRIFHVEAADPTPGGQFRLRVQNAAGQAREMLMRRLGDGLTSCMYEPGWQLPESAYLACRKTTPRAGAASDPEHRETHTLLAAGIEQRVQALGPHERPATSSSLEIDYELHLPPDGQLTGGFALDVTSPTAPDVLWSGKAVFEMNDNRTRADNVGYMATLAVDQLFEMLATRKPRDLSP